MKIVLNTLGIAILALAATSNTALATRCEDKVGMAATGTVLYTDRTLWEDYLERGGSEDTAQKKFYIQNATGGRRINDLKVQVYDKLDVLLAETIRGPNIKATNGISYVNNMAVFYVPWDNFNWRLKISYRWVNASKKWTRMHASYRWSWQDGIQLIKDASPDPVPDWLSDCR